MGRNPIYKLITGHRGKIVGVQCQIKMAVEGKSCEVCGKTFCRKLYDNGIFEEWKRFYLRRTCSKECKTIMQTGAGNPKWRGGLPICTICGERTKWYQNKNKVNQNNEKLNPQKYCLKCYRKILVKRFTKTNK